MARKKWDSAHPMVAENLHLFTFAAYEFEKRLNPKSGSR